MAKTELAGVPGLRTEHTKDKPILDRLLSLKEAAGLLGISPHTLRKYLAKGELPRVKFLRSVRLDPADLQAFIQKHKETRGRFPGG